MSLSGLIRSLSGNHDSWGRPHSARPPSDDDLRIQHPRQEACSRPVRSVPVASLAARGGAINEDTAARHTQPFLSGLLRGVRGQEHVTLEKRPRRGRFSLWCSASPASATPRKRTLPLLMCRQMGCGFVTNCFDAVRRFSVRPRLKAIKRTCRVNGVRTFIGPNQCPESPSV